MEGKKQSSRGDEEGVWMRERQEMREKERWRGDKGGLKEGDGRGEGRRRRGEGGTRVKGRRGRVKERTGRGKEASDVGGVRAKGKGEEGG